MTDTPTPTCENTPECSSPEFSDGDLDLWQIKVHD